MHLALLFIFFALTLSQANPGYYPQYNVQQPPQGYAMQNPDYQQQFMQYQQPQQPPMMYQQPQQPPMMYQQPQQPPMMYQQPPMMYQQPPMMYQQPQQPPMEPESKTEKIKNSLQDKFNHMGTLLGPNYQGSYFQARKLRKEPTMWQKMKSWIVGPINTSVSPFAKEEKK